MHANFGVCGYLLETKLAILFAYRRCLLRHGDIKRTINQSKQNRQPEQTQPRERETEKEREREGERESEREMNEKTLLSGTCTDLEFVRSHLSSTLLELLCHVVCHLLAVSNIQS